MKRYMLSAVLALTSYTALADTAIQTAPVQPATQSAPKPFGLDDVTPAQLKEMAGIRQAYMEKMTAKRPTPETIKKDTTEWEAILKAPSFDEPKARAFLEKMDARQLEMELLQAKADNETYNVLTQKQKDEFEKRRQGNQ
ncbi:Spy/CpxP family protein refolding chaperone [Vibrio natriegens]|uniref:Spy/CpxP family protein refolding chaperone n=1 Tax=Vibrio natriegens TaxID=691 RepID=UPI001EFC3928|nr:Spy/CpxP family protein refolding chaperone [Vibrio natriegens]MCG9702737.1 Spy/CpxP family protein refolding chaperone [Vibrio natriegens]